MDGEEGENWILILYTVLTDISRFGIIIKFLHVQIARIDVVELVGLLVPRQTVGDANIVPQNDKFLGIRKAIEFPQALFPDVGVKL